MGKIWFNVRRWQIYTPTRNLIRGIRPWSYKTPMHICLHVLPHWIILSFISWWYQQTSPCQSLLNVVQSCVIVLLNTILVWICVPKSNAELKVTFPQPKPGYSFLTFGKILSVCDVQISLFGFCFIDNCRSRIQKLATFLFTVFCETIV